MEINRQYIGARYVPKFYSGTNGAEWNENQSYEPLTIVTYLGNSYTSKKPVPANIGNPMNNGEYWAATGNYNEQVEAYRREVQTVVEDMAELKDYVDDEILKSVVYEKPENYGAVGDGVADDTEAIKSAIATGKPILLSKTYRITEGLEAVNDILGYGGCLYMDANAVFIVHTAHNVRGLEVKSNSSRLTELGIYITDTTNNPTIENCYIHDLYNSENGDIDHAVFGIFVTGSDSNTVVAIRNNVVKDIIGNYTSWQSVYNACGIAVSCTGEAIVDGNIVINVVDNYNGDGISVIPRAATNSHYTVTNNKVKGCGVDGIKITARYSLVDNNVIDLDGSNGSSAFTGTYGIRVLSIDTVVSNNAVISSNNANTSYGIFAQHENSAIDGYITLGENTIINTMIGVYINVFNKCMIKGNRFESSVSNHKSLIALGAGHTIKDNKGISYLECGAGSRIENNEITGEMPFTYITNLVVTGNKIHDTSIICNDSNSFVDNEFVNVYLNCGNNAIVKGNRFTNSSGHTSTIVAVHNYSVVSDNILKGTDTVDGVAIPGDYCSIVGNNISGCSVPIDCPSTHNTVVGNVITSGTPSVASGNQVGLNIGLT